MHRFVKVGYLIVGNSILRSVFSLWSVFCDITFKLKGYVHAQIDSGSLGGSLQGSAPICPAACLCCFPHQAASINYKNLMLKLSPSDACSMKLCGAFTEELFVHVRCYSCSHLAKDPPVPPRKVGRVIVGVALWTDMRPRTLLFHPFYDWFAMQMPLF